MKQEYIFLFPPFRFDPANAQVRNGAQEIPLRPQASPSCAIGWGMHRGLSPKKSYWSGSLRTRMAAKEVSGLASGSYSKLSGIRREPRGSLGRSTIGDIDLYPRLTSTPSTPPQSRRARSGTGTTALDEFLLTIILFSRCSCDDSGPGKPTSPRTGLPNLRGVLAWGKIQRHF